MSNPTTINLGTLTQPILLFGGPYSNLEATLAMHEVAKEHGIRASHVVCTGDIVAYCANPQETIDVIRQWGIHVVMGNCEESLGFNNLDCGCGFEEGTVCATLSVDWYNYALRKTESESRNWMKTLPREIQFDVNGIRFSVIHGGVSNISEFVFASSDPSKKKADIKKLDAHCVIGGHSGIPFGQRIDDLYWLNAGVIGMPANDGKQNGWYMIINPTRQGAQASWHPLHFDHNQSAKAMEIAGLPPEYQKSLISGLWPSLSILPPKETSLQGVALSPTTQTLHSPSV